MSDGGQVRRSRPSEQEIDDQADASAPPAATESTEAGGSTADLLDDVDELLDEIDDVLETNAEEFIRSYVQKGGQ